MKIELTPEEHKIILHAIRYWQIHKAPFEGKEYRICDEIVKKWFIPKTVSQVSEQS